MSKMTITMLNAPCGAGKTHYAAEEMIAVPGRYLVVRDRVQAIHEIQSKLTQMAADANRHVVIDRVTSECSSNVRNDVADLPSRFGSMPHVVVFITHRALLMCDFAGFSGWHIFVDETPAIFDQQDLVTTASVDRFRAHYQLESVNSVWSSVTLTHDGWSVTPASLEKDDLLRALRTFHERVTAATPVPEQLSARAARRAFKGDNRAVICNLQKWEEMVDSRRWGWWSVWSPTALSAFETVTFMANGLDQSLTFQLLKAWHPEVLWMDKAIKSYREFRPRSVFIEYFAEAHVASKSLFGSEAGRANLTAIGDHLACREQIWMANEAHAGVLLGRMGGMHLMPLQAGSNRFASYHAATCLYSAKPNREARDALKFIGIDPAAWTHSNEYEAILQFMCRSSIRDPDSAETVTLTVYDREQAAYLERYFVKQPHCLVSTALVDLGFAHQERRSGRPRTDLSAEEATAKNEADKARRSAAERARRALVKLAKTKNPSMP